MKPQRKNTTWLALPVALLILLAANSTLAPSALSQSDDRAKAASQATTSLEMNPSVIGGGGGASANGSRRVEGTIGQSVVGTSAGAAFTLESGFWNAAVPCLSLALASQTFAASGGIGSVQVIGSTACAWTAVSNNPDFITITSGGGSGDGTVTYSVAAHSNPAPRSGIITVAGQSFTVLQGAAFTDVPQTHIFYEFIGKLSARGVTQGCGGGNYCPDAPVTREQMAAFIIRARGEFNPPTPTMQRFLDVPPSNVFYNFIDRMAALGITSGCGGGNYCPSQPVTRGQMAVFLVRAFNL